MDATHCRSRSVATRIAEVADADQPDEHEKPIGHDGGFLWRMNSYWRFEEKDQGVYVEVESISLTRDIPMGLGWLIKPFVTSIPRESLLMTLGSTRSAVEGKVQVSGVEVAAGLPRHRASTTMDEWPGKPAATSRVAGAPAASRARKSGKQSIFRESARHLPGWRATRDCSGCNRRSAAPLR